MSSSAPIFLIAHPRSGTHALTSMISQKPEIFVFGEVFNPSPDSEVYPANYYHFLRAMLDTPLASPKNAETRFSAYLGYLRSRARNLRLLVDAKYDTLHLFDMELRDISSPPTIFSFMNKHGVQIIHLKRNVLHVYLSLMHATATNQWQVMKGEQAKRQPLLVDVEHMMDFLTKKSFEQQQVSRFVRSTDSYIEVWYEQLFGDGAAGAFHDLSMFLDIDNLMGEQSTFTKQLTQPYDQIVQNWEEVVRALTHSPLAHLLEGAPPSERPLTSLIAAQ
jgi:hypothetical protein